MHSIYRFTSATPTLMPPPVSPTCYAFWPIAYLLYFPPVILLMSVVVIITWEAALSHQSNTGHI